MYDYGSSYGESCYRLMARTGQFIYLKTRGYLDIDKETNQVRSFVCHNTLISEEEGRKLIREMKKKFAIMIQENDLPPVECDEPAVENPVQLERAILSLITNLHSTGDAEESVASPIGSYSSDEQHETDSLRSAKSPPLALIAPKSETIKDSIRNSIKVIASASRGRTPDLQVAEQSTKRPPMTIPSRNDENQRRPSVVQKIENFQRSAMRHRQQSPTSLPPPSLTTTNITSSTQSLDQSTVAQQPYVKQETIESRVPPLPTNAKYFSDTNLYASSSSPTDNLPPSYNEQQSTQPPHQHHNQQQPPPPPQQQHYSHQQHQRQSPINQSFNLKGHSSGYGTPIVGRSTSVLKRTHSYETEDSVAKRRQQTSPQISPTSSSFLEINSTTCIDQLCETSPGLIFDFQKSMQNNIYFTFFLFRSL